jgi:tetratricopeptide (TPR) repeat protein
MRASHEILWSRSHADGERLFDSGHYPEAEGKLHDALQHARAAGIEDARLACTLYRLGNLAERCGHTGAALDYYRRALETEELALGPDHPYVAMVMRGYAAMLRRAGHAGQAAALDARAAAIWDEPRDRCAISGKTPEVKVA